MIPTNAMKNTGPLVEEQIQVSLDCEKQLATLVTLSGDKERDMGVSAKIGVSILFLILNAITIYGVATAVVTNSLAGFNTSQTTLSDSVVQLQSSLDQQRSWTDSKVTEQRADTAAAITESSKRLEVALNALSGKFDGLGEKLETSGNKVAELTGTVSALNDKLDSSIARQTNFEQVVIARLLKEDPSSAEPAKAMMYWEARGIGPAQYQEITGSLEAESVATWLKLYNPKLNDMKKVNDIIKQ